MHPAVDAEDASDPQQEITSNRTSANESAEPVESGVDPPTPLPLPTLLDSSDAEESSSEGESESSSEGEPPWSIAALALPPDRTTLSYADWRRVFQQLKKNCTCTPFTPQAAIDPRPKAAQKSVSFKRWQPPRPAEADNAHGGGRAPDLRARQYRHLERWIRSAKAAEVPFFVRAGDFEIFIFVVCAHVGFISRTCSI